MLGLSGQLQQEEDEAHDIPAYFKCSEGRAAVSASQEAQEQQVIWTDGASPKNQDDRFRRAGSGIYYGHGHSLNMSAILPGLVQTNQRAELLAVVLACLRDPRPLDIRSDSSYVCNGFASWRSWVNTGWVGDHADLWNLLGGDLRSRATVVVVSWVKGHAKQIDIDRGRTTKEDKEGNDGADALAVAGANMHCAAPEVVEAGRERRDVAMSVQRMMLAILHARALAENAFQNEATETDRGSELGDCMRMDDSGTEELYVSVTETACAFACHDDAVFDEFTLLDLHVAGAVAQVDVPNDTLDMEGRPVFMHEHVVQMNLLNDEFDDGFH